MEKQPAAQSESEVTRMMGPKGYWDAGVSCLMDYWSSAVVEEWKARSSTPVAFERREQRVALTTNPRTPGATSAPVTVTCSPVITIRWLS